MRTTNDADASRVVSPAGGGRDALAATGGREAPAAIAVDLGSGQARLWSVGDGIRVARTADEAFRPPTPLVERGRVVDAAGCASLLTRLLHTLPKPLPVGPLVVACRPVLATPADQDAIRRVVTAAFAPSRVLLVETVRAAAIGSSAAAGLLLVADVGAQLTEVAVLVDGRVAAARSAEMGTHDRTAARAPRLLAGVVTRLVADLGRNPRTRRLTAAALPRGVIVIGDGATTPGLTVRLAANLRVPVRPAASPRLAALSGAGLAAAAACRHPAIAAA